jgi:hypothetical protein
MPDGAAGHDSTAAAGYEEGRRGYLRRLDDCLHLLEDAHENGSSVVSERMAEVVGVRVPTIATGMRIADAIEEVLRYQEPFMKRLPVEERRRSKRRRWDVLTPGPRA